MMSFFQSQLGLVMSVIWTDNDLLELSVSVSNGGFAGHARIYISLDEPQRIAAVLQGFPRNQTDTREVTLGAFGPDQAGGALKLNFYCVNRAAHAFVTAQIESDPLQGKTLQHSQLIFRIEAAALDNFVADLQRMGRDQRGTAFLSATPGI